MKDTIKNSIIGAFAIFGLVALISSSNNAPTVIQDGTPESHVWEMVTESSNDKVRAWSINKVTGEVRRHETYYGYLKSGHYGGYVVTKQE